MSEQQAPYTIIHSGDHTHLFRVASGERVVRWCETCGQAWMMQEFHELIQDVYVYRWTEIQEASQEEL